jgi:uncharacterized protein (TIGR03663 family)
MKKADRRFYAAFAAILLLAAGLRLYGLGERFFNWDEGLVIWFTQSYAKSGTYVYDPLNHGPFPFWPTAAIYGLAGFSEAPSRALPVIFGTGLVSLALLGRRFFGDRATLLTALFLSVSPIFLYFSRFYRNDIYVAFFSLAAYFSLLRFFEARRSKGVKRRDLWLILTAALLSLGLTAKENTLITAFVFVSFLLFWHLYPQLRKRKLDISKSSPLIRAVQTAMLLAPIILISGIVMASNISQSLRFLAFTAILAISCFAAYRKMSRPYGGLFAAVCAGTWIYAFFYSSFFVLRLPLEEPFLKMLIWTSTGIEGPPYYHLFRMVLYELPVLVFGLLGAAHYIAKKRFEMSLLLYWFATALVVYSGVILHKQPQLTMHIALPLVLLATSFLGERVLARRKPWRNVSPRQKAAITAFAVLMIFYAATSLSLNYVRFADPREPLVYAQGPQELRPFFEEVVLRLKSGESVTFLEQPGGLSMGWQPFFIFMRGYSFSYSLRGNENLIIAAPERAENLTAYTGAGYTSQTYNLWKFYPHEEKLLENLANWRFWLFRETTEQPREQFPFVVLRRA